MAKLNIKIILFLLLSVLIFSNCSSNKEFSAPYLEETVDDVRFLHNFQPDIHKQIRFIEELIIGNDSIAEENMFLDPSEIEIDSEGNLYILEKLDSTIKKYNPSGHLIKKIGRQGQGPGEFVELSSIEINSKNEIFAYDSRLRKIEVFTTNGNLIKTIKLNRYTVKHFKLGKDGTLFIGQEKLKPINNKSKLHYTISIYNMMTNKDYDICWMRPIGLETMQFKYKGGILSFSNALNVKWNINSLNHIYIESPNNYEVYIYSSKGDLLLVFDRTLKSLYNKDISKQEFIEEFSAFRKEYFPKANQGSVSLYPVFRSISIDEKDRVWIRLMTSDSFGSASCTYFDVFSKNGVYLFTTKIDRAVDSNLAFKNGFLVVLIVNDKGYKNAVKMRIVEE